jgi:SAM-dependent methyltransferase
MPEPYSPDPIRRNRLALLRDLYGQFAKAHPEDTYIAAHSGEPFLNGTEQVFDWYQQWVPRAGQVLDWGCRHAPDACLIRLERNEDLVIQGCDVVDGKQYSDPFYGYSGLQYSQLDHPYKLPFADNSFECVIASGVLEHVPLDYESLKELNRVVKHGGVLVITFLPNKRSVQEKMARMKADEPTTPGVAHHLRVYGTAELRSLLLHAGFMPEVIGHQTHFDLLQPRTDANERRRVLSRIGRLIGAAEVTSCLAAVAKKLDYF